MEQTVVGVFDSTADAQRARESLLSAGFGADQVSVQAHEGSVSTTSSTAGGTSAHADHEGGFMGGVSRFFRDLFGTEDEHAGHYAEAVRRVAPWSRYRRATKAA